MVAEDGASPNGERVVTFKDGRCSIAGTGRASGTYPDNKVKTSKYTWVTFVPLNLFEQMHKFGNIYFLCISVLMYFGQHSSLFVGTINYLSTLGVLLLMMAVTGVMALLDDIKRGRADSEVNSRPAVVVEGGGETRKKWEGVRVGDLLVVSKDEELPADIVLLYSTGDEGTCYVSTANLDGENNLKLKSALHATQSQLGNAGRAQVLKNFAGLAGSVGAEAPQASIYAFKGVLRIEKGEGSRRRGVDEPLSSDQLLLRGTILKITDWVLGVVVYTGMQTRMVMNSMKDPPMKRSNTEAVTNTVMLVVLCVQGLLAAISDAMFLGNKEALHDHWYLHFPHLILPDVVAYWLTFFVLYSNLMPISLYPSLELCTAAQTYFIKNDANMYYRNLRVPAGVRSSNLTDELGQVSYVFSDKTGTLTQNVMELKRVSVAGKTFGTLEEGVRGFNGKEALQRAMSANKRNGLMSMSLFGGCGPSASDSSDQIRDFFEVMAVAHTAMAVEGPGDQLSYEAESPDEAALVDAAAQVGWTFKGRVGQTMTVSVDTKGAKEQRKYKVLAVNAFDSTRKRMSVVVEHNGACHLLVKGADNAMLERKTSRQDALEKHLTEFAKEGLRTLVFARRSLTAEDKKNWLRKYEAAQCVMTDRAGALADAANEIERHLDVVGATAIEDKLQDGVRETIIDIKAAGIKLWVLTGDKLETAYSIGLSSGVLTADTYVHYLDAPIQPHEVGRTLFELECRATEAGAGPCALMVTGGAFSVLQSSQILLDEFVKHARLCSVVIACRVSPSQKAEVVRLVRKGIKPQPVTLAIGDGANDVPMIQEAQIGVGVAGLEGCQAVNSSDFSVGQFRFLRRLLLVHGRWNYRRICKVTLFTFWRNAVQVLLIFFYTLVSGFSGTSLFEDWIRMAFNPLGSIPIVATGCFDQDVDDATLLSHPHLYDVGRTGRDLNVVQMVLAILDAVVHSAVIWGVALLAVPHMDVHGAGDYYTFGTSVYSALMVDLFIRVAFLSYTRNRFTVGAIMLSLIAYIVYLLVYPCTKLVTSVLSPNMYMVPYHMASNPAFWLCICAAPTLNWLLDVFTHFLWQTLDPREARLSSLRQKSFKDRASQVSAEKDGWAILREDEEALLPVSGDEGGASTDGRDSQGPQSPMLAGQRYYGWVPPEMGCFPVSALMLVAGALLLAVGAWSYVDAREARQVRIVYEGTGRWGPVGTDGPSEVFQRQDECRGRDCTIKVSVPHHMRSPVYVYYAVSPFYQNFNDYLKSEVSKELGGLSVSPSEREAKCIESTRVSGTDEIVPCGMKAASFFNDTFEFEGIPLDTSGINWASDLDRFHNPSDYHDRADTSWLFNRFPGVVKEREGVENHHFIAWMRPAALNYVWKRYGELNRSLEAGTELKIGIRSNFPVEEFNGSKQLVLTEVGALGGHSYELSYLLLGSGAGCLLLAAVVVLVWLCGRALSKRTDTSTAPADKS